MTRGGGGGMCRAKMAGGGTRSGGRCQDEGPGQGGWVEPRQMGWG